MVLRATWMRERDGFLLMFSIEDASTFEQLDAFYNQLLDMHDENLPPLLLVGNKADLGNDRRQAS